MKTLYIARHAKSSWDDFSLKDHDRPILPKGKNKTIIVAEKLKSLNEIPEIILSSTAKRAVQTAEIYAGIFNIPSGKILKSSNLYLAGPDEIFNELYGIDNKINSIMVVGHNPGLTETVNLFTKDAIYNLPTSAVAKVVFNTGKWEEINNAGFNTEFILTPKNITKK